MLNKENIELITKSQIGDFKTYLQELSQKNLSLSSFLPDYKRDWIKNIKNFYMQVYIGTQLYGIGSGKIKRS